LDEGALRIPEKLMIFYLLQMDRKEEDKKETKGGNSGQLISCPISCGATTQRQESNDRIS